MKSETGSEQKCGKTARISYFSPHPASFVSTRQHDYSSATQREGLGGWRGHRHKTRPGRRCGAASSWPGIITEARPFPRSCSFHLYLQLDFPPSPSAPTYLTRPPLSWLLCPLTATFPKATVAKVCGPLVTISSAQTECLENTPFFIVVPPWASTESSVSLRGLVAAAGTQTQGSL